MHTFEAIRAGQRIPVADPRRPSHKSPLFCHRMILKCVYLASLPESLHFLLKSFRCVGNSIDLDMTGVYWNDDRDTRRPVCPLLDVNMKISAMDCTSPIEPVWSAFTQIGASSIYYMDPSGERPSVLLLYTSDLDIISNASQFLFTSLCVVRDLSEYVTRLQVFRGPLNEVEEENDLSCAVSVHEIEDPPPIAVTLEFFAPSGRRLTHDIREVASTAEQRERVSKVVLRFRPFTDESDSDDIEYILKMGWDDLFKLLLKLPKVTCVELLFAGYDDLVRFVHEQWEALTLLRKLVDLRYDAPCEGVTEVHLHTRHKVEMCASGTNVEIIGSVEVKVRADYEPPRGPRKPYALEEETDSEEGYMKWEPPRGTGMIEPDFEEESIIIP
ncbi:hypothetical protein BDW22DRAFT_722346 [Trametopsis cervina]|nr:hypothetical protein BDW22DRAFT_722346 [Trametopsis cervina]